MWLRQMRSETQFKRLAVIVTLVWCQNLYCSHLLTIVMWPGFNSTVLHHAMCVTDVIEPPPDSCYQHLGCTSCTSSSTLDCFRGLRCTPVSAGGNPLGNVAARSPVECYILCLDSSCSSFYFNSLSKECLLYSTTQPQDVLNFSDGWHFYLIMWTSFNFPNVANSELLSKLRFFQMILILFRHPRQQVPFSFS